MQFPVSQERAPRPKAIDGSCSNWKGVREEVVAVLPGGEVRSAWAVVRVRDFLLRSRMAIETKALDSRAWAMRLAVQHGPACAPLSDVLPGAQVQLPVEILQAWEVPDVWGLAEWGRLIGERR